MFKLRYHICHDELNRLSFVCSSFNFCSVALVIIFIVHLPTASAQPTTTSTKNGKSGVTLVDYTTHTTTILTEMTRISGLWVVGIIGMAVLVVACITIELVKTLHGYHRIQPADDTRLQN